MDCIASTRIRLQCCNNLASQNWREEEKVVYIGTYIAYST